jgi:hypothetical protein
MSLRKPLLALLHFQYPVFETTPSLCALEVHVAWAEAGAEQLISFGLVTIKRCFVY